MTPATVIARVDADLADDADLAAIDRLLQQDAPAFARPREHLETAHERLGEAAVDRERIVLVARAGGTIVGVVDARLHHPEPGALTIAAIAVARDARRRGLGVQLLEAAAAAAREQDDGEPPTLVAGVHTDNPHARAFFEAQGFRPSDESGRVIILTRS